MKRVLTVAALSVAMLSLSTGPAWAHAVSVNTPSGQTHIQGLHAGDASLPSHSGAFTYRVICNVIGNPAITILGPADCD